MKHTTQTWPKKAIPVPLKGKKPSAVLKKIIEQSGRFWSNKLFILDTNVLIHDPMSIFRFEEHDICIPMMVLEELDNNKKGSTEVARSARQASRMLDELVSEDSDAIRDGIDLSEKSHSQATGKLFFQTEAIDTILPASLPTAKADNQIIAVLIHFSTKYPDRKVVLVSKDINMRIKAQALGQQAQDYFSDQVLEDTDLLYTGTLELPSTFWDMYGNAMKTWKEGMHTFYEFKGKVSVGFFTNEFVWSDGTRPFRAMVQERTDQHVVLHTCTDYTHAKNSVWGITARNREQNFALSLLMNPEIDFITLSGQAGTGKTLLTLAAALDQTINKNLYSDIIFTRVTMPIGEDIGFLPGTEEEKMIPWMGAMEDNLDVLGANNSPEPHKEGEKKHQTDWNRIAVTGDLIRSRLKVKSLNFMRGRTFINKFLIIDEAQNLTPKQMKTLITRAGPKTKVVCLGNIAQIDTPYLTEGSSGLTYAVDRFKDWEHSGHVTLLRGERSRLADHAAEVL
ncbi:MAG: PhoH family protein [Candidatus Moranbacteria bacterium]|nr:PhoH family protein [Candidatus Moranbacteria bacterium]PIP25344.1 MAG: ribonuclease [Candidatus Moranbacteria bacterium CG23_combo_of_CG06-09_8_20_14_all_41_28]PIV86366.1 MAG: ribonuclease [Candidatus Moranbacteria bacterium CG17_big_fil_post_rev_8_21_14_2_50_41_107]PIW94361.1 MAG: ribonuclease [Candidatus Moranbacteria bacterium CG_4_8_14_3_um_filter_41_13]PIX91737.1 MAG: ribonuclease [Candidatus Moranbacteria bacterium CG_4_10_14_3_um_filter_41_65]PJC00140.1 MAG: ribonuclease [Candidatus